MLGLPFGGLGVGIEAGAAATVQVSNANSLDDLTGWFGYFSVSGDLGIGLSVTVFYGWNKAGRFIFGGDFGPSAGAGADAAGGASYTWILHRFGGWEAGLARSTLSGIVNGAQQKLDYVRKLLEAHGIMTSGSQPPC
jgi:hypothetical protein